MWKLNEGLTSTFSGRMGRGLGWSQETPFHGLIVTWTSYPRQILPRVLSAFLFQPRSKKGWGGWFPQVGISMAKFASVASSLAQYCWFTGSSSGCPQAGTAGRVGLGKQKRDGQMEIQTDWIDWRKSPVRQRTWFFTKFFPLGRSAGSRHVGQYVPV